ncbi:hypothetical protein B0J11DRAFT_573844 [Dendryphion nanum]|uniref:Uncharacterized protein n=1 Tax=Dendryphion nanum TaxID=256645 RepID=A0A9P9I752_9PLEO|nr:hypothetical protein B0J11DRAFT_573844 [Dendryphion nanum]
MVHNIMQAPTVCLLVLAYLVLPVIDYHEKIMASEKMIRWFRFMRPIDLMVIRAYRIALGMLQRVAATVHAVYLLVKEAANPVPRNKTQYSRVHGHLQERSHPAVPPYTPQQQSTDYPIDTAEKLCRNQGPSDLSEEQRAYLNGMESINELPEDKGPVVFPYKNSSD